LPIFTKGLASYDLAITQPSLLLNTTMGVFATSGGSKRSQLISFGEFEVEFDSTARHQVYFGKALIEAYKAEQQEKWNGITILPSAWGPFDVLSPGSIDAFASEKAWLKRGDGVLLLNPFIKLRSWYSSAVMGEVDKPYSRLNASEFPNDIVVFKFLREQAAAYALKNDFSSPAAIKCHTTIRLLETVLGKDLYAWGEQAALPINF